MRAVQRTAGVLVVSLVLGWPGPVAARGAPGLCRTAAGSGADGPVVAILSAFPAELVPLLAASTVESTAEIEGRTYYRGRLDGVRVVLGLMGIGMVNARTSTEAVVTHFPVAALVVSGVAGSTHRIADVVVADDWTDRDAGDVFVVNAALQSLAARAARGAPALAGCTIVPPTSPSGQLVCVPFEPAVVLGGHGVSGDPYAGEAVACIAGGGEVLGCEVPSSAVGAMVAAVEAGPEVEDMETAAVARVAAEHRIPFLGVRAVSDGAGDPLGDRGFPAQFFDYYRLAATNAGAVVRRTVGSIAGLTGNRAGRRICRLFAAHRWGRAATLLAARGS